MKKYLHIFWNFNGDGVTLNFSCGKNYQTQIIIQTTVFVYMSQHVWRGSLMTSFISWNEFQQKVLHFCCGLYLNSVNVADRFAPKALID